MGKSYVSHVSKLCLIQYINDPSVLSVEPMPSTGAHVGLRDANVKIEGSKFSHFDYPRNDAFAVRSKQNIEPEEELYMGYSSTGYA